MKYNYIQISEDNRDAFADVLPEKLKLKGKRVAVGAVDDEGTVLGAMSYILMEYEYIVDWIYVEPEMRRNHIGTGFIDLIIKMMRETGDAFPLTIRYEFADDDRLLHHFFISLSYMDSDYSHERYYITADEIKNASLPKRNADHEMKITNFFDETYDEQLKLLATIAAGGEYFVDEYSEWKEQCVSELCRVLYVGEEAVDLIFVQRLSDGNLELSYLYGKDPVGLLELISMSITDMIKLYPNASLVFDAINEESLKIAEYLFPDSKSVHIYEAGF